MLFTLARSPQHCDFPLLIKLVAPEDALLLMLLMLIMLLLHDVRCGVVLARVLCVCESFWL